MWRFQMQANVPSIEALLTQAQLRWSGHLVHMPHNKLPKQLFYGELTEGHQPRGWSMLHCKDTEKITPEVLHWWRTMGNKAISKSERKQAIRKAAEAFENVQRVSQEEKTRSSKGQNERGGLPHQVSNMWQPMCVWLWSQVPQEGTQINNVLGWTSSITIVDH